MREKYESLSLATLKDLAKARGLKGVSTLRKPELIERMLQEDQLENEENNKKAEKKIKRTITNPMYTEFEIRVNQATDKLRVSLSEDKKGGSKLDVKFSSDVDVDKILNALAELLMNC